MTGSCSAYAELRIIDASPKRSIGDQCRPMPKLRSWRIENSRETKSIGLKPPAVSAIC